MSATTLGTLARTVSGALLGGDAAIDGVSTDTRTLRGGQLFVAIVGPNFDGHDFVESAAAAGAAGALVSRELPVDIPQVVVDDTRAALGRYASAWRLQFEVPVVGVTGSNGKTTVKEMTAAILRERGCVLATRGNLNNDIGLPLTLLGMATRHRAAVIEMGASRGGEIAALTEITRPGVGVVTNAGPAHLEGFGDLEGVARAKGELYAGLPADGHAVINADDAFAPLWTDLAQHCKRVSFGIGTDCDYTAHDLEVAPVARFKLVAPGGERDITLPVPGRHNVINALAATATAVAAGANLDDAVAGLTKFSTVNGRLRLTAAQRGAQVIDDSYNANPASLDAAMDVLAAQPGRRWLVLGDMLELGNEAHELHARAGEKARVLGIERVFALGPMAAVAAEAFGDGAESFVDHEALAARVATDLAADVIVLVKGSRGMRMERVVMALTDPAAQRNGTDGG